MESTRSFCMELFFHTVQGSERTIILAVFLSKAVQTALFTVPMFGRRKQEYTFRQSLDDPRDKSSSDEYVNDPRLSIEYHSRSASIDLAKAKNSVPNVTTIADLQVNDHVLDVEKIFEKYKSSIEGISAEESKIRFLANGPNKMDQPDKFGPLVRNILNQFISGFCILLWIAAFLCFIAWKPLGSPPGNWTNTTAYAYEDPNNFALAIILVVIIFIQVGFNLFQQWSSTR